MKLVSWSADSDSAIRIGALLDRDPDNARVVDLQHAYARYLRDSSGDPFAAAIAAVRIPHDMLRLLQGGALSLDAARDALRHAQQLLEQDRARHATGPLIRPLAQVRLHAPLARPGKIIAVGANYSGHIQEGRSAGVLRDLPDYPVAFLKMPSAVIGPDDDIVRSTHTDELDYEIELSMVIGTRCRNVPAGRWRDVVMGFTIVNDISMRDLIVQEKPTGVVFQGKNLDTTCPLGPCIVTEDDIADPGALDIRLSVNGETRQQDNTRHMIHSCGRIIEYWSSRLTLEPGDVVTTGTTSGVAGFNRRFPERLLRHGDVIEAQIQSIGTLRNRVVDETTLAAGAHPSPATTHAQEL